MDETMLTAETIPSEHNEPPQTKVTPNECEESHLQEETFCLPVKFNKQDYQLSKDEATALAQKGMKFDTIEPMLHKLKNLAQQNGTSLGDLVDALCAPAQPTEQVSVEERLAEEFLALQAGCPEITDFEQLPSSVVDEAVQSGETLLLSYLRYCYRENQKVSEAKTAAALAGAASTGSLGGAVPTPTDPAVEAMLRGVRG